MKRFVSMLIAAIMCLSLCAYASAASKDLQFDAQPSTQTVKAGGNCQFVVKCSNQKTITWHFVNPDTEEEVTGKKLPDYFKELNKTKKKAEKLTVLNPNSKTITIKNVPEELHGWKVYCTIGTTKNNQLNSDTVYILIKGMPVPDEAKEDSSEDEEEPSEDEEEPSEDEEEPSEDEEEPFEDEEEPSEDEEEPSEDEEEPSEDEEEPSEDEEEPAKKETSKKETAKKDSAKKESAKKDSITVKAVNALIYPIIDEQTSDSGATECTLSAPASFEVYASKDPVCWRINGVNVILPEMTNHLTILFTEDDMTVEALTAMPATPTDLDEDMSEDEEEPIEEEPEEEEPSEEDEETEEEPKADKKEKAKDKKEDESEETEEPEEEEEKEDKTKMCTVKCENCRFTGGDYQYVTTGEVPSGTIITVVATDGDTAKGYSINGGEYGGKGKSTVRIVVYEDSVISMQKRKGA